MTFQSIMNMVSLWILPVILILILTVALYKKVPIYEEFTDGAKDGFKVAVNIIPYLVAIIVAISMFRASGIIEMLESSLAGVLSAINVPAAEKIIRMELSLVESAAGSVLYDSISITGVIIFIPLSIATLKRQTIKKTMSPDENISGNIGALSTFVFLLLSSDGISSSTICLSKKCSIIA